MSGTFWAIAISAVVVLVLLLFSGNGGTVLGFDNDVFAGASLTALWGAFIVSSVVHRGMDWSGALVQLAIWALILATLTAAYSLF